MIKSINLDIEEVRSILDGDKDYVIVLPTSNRFQYYKLLRAWDVSITSEDFFSKYLPYTKGDAMYVKERWVEHPKLYNKYLYLADKLTPREQSDVVNYDTVRWKSSVCMPKVASRIWLKVTDIRCMKLQDLSAAAMAKELPGNMGEEVSAVGSLATVQLFAWYWDSKLVSSELVDKGWKANPCVYVIHFDRISAPNITVQLSDTKKYHSMTEEDKAKLLIKLLREKAENDISNGRDITSYTESAVSLVKEIFKVEDNL